MTPKNEDRGEGVFAPSSSPPLSHPEKNSSPQSCGQMKTDIDREGGLEGRWGGGVIGCDRPHGIF